MTERHLTGHSTTMAAAAMAEVPIASARPRHAAVGASLRFETVYDRWFDFVWRSIRRLGVPEAYVDDAVQEVFVVVHRKLATFEGRSLIKTWLFGIAMRVAKDQRRAAARRRPTEPLRESIAGAPAGGCCPMELASKNEAARLLHEILDQLDDDKRVVFVMAELEQMTMPDIAEALGVKLNTAYSRLRLARAAFEQALERHRARDAWRQP